MNCPKCNHKKNTVLDTRKDDKNIYRKRQCKECKHIWFTEEIESYEAKYNLQRAQYLKYKNKSNCDKTKKIMLPSPNYRICCSWETYGGTRSGNQYNTTDEVFRYLDYIASKPNDIRTVSLAINYFDGKCWKVIACKDICNVDDSITQIVQNWLNYDCGIELD